MHKKIEEKVIQEDNTIRKVIFEDTWFYSLEDMKKYLGEDLKGVESIVLPFKIDGKRINVKCATLTDIEQVRKKEPLTDFDNKIIQALNFNPKKK